MSPDPNCRRLLSHPLEFRIRCAGPAGAYLNKQTKRGMNSSDLCLHGRNSSQNSQAHLSFVCLVIWKWDNLSCHCSTCHLLFAIFPSQMAHVRVKHGHPQASQLTCWVVQCHGWSERRWTSGFRAASEAQTSMKALFKGQCWHFFPGGIIFYTSAPINSKKIRHLSPVRKMILFCLGSGQGHRQ